MFSDEPFRTLLATSQNREVAYDEKQDVYDGEIWKEFLENPLDTSVPFLSNQNNIGLMLNVDWFKPFKRSEYKVAALMMTVLNLPRAERFKERWRMVLGIIPGPTEPKGNINNGVWYSELIRLSYFDIVRMSITDPMHTFLLGMAHNEIKLCLSSLPKDKKLQFQDCQSTI